jgi:hypothetical protein
MQDEMEISWLEIRKLARVDVNRESVVFLFVINSKHFFPTGFMWTTNKFTSEWWEIEGYFRVTGRGRVGADGFVRKQIISLKIIQYIYIYTYIIISFYILYCLVSYDVTLQISIKNIMIALHECRKWEDQVKVSYHRKFWTFKS